MAQPTLLYLAAEDWAFASHFAPMAETARACGYRPVVACRVTDRRAELESRGIAVEALPFDRAAVGPLALARLMLDYWRVIRRHEPAVVHCISLRVVLLGGLCAWLASRAQIVLAVTGLGYIGVRTTPAARLMRSAIRLVLALFCLSPRFHFLFENEDDPAFLGVTPRAADRLTIVPGAGVPREAFTPRAEPAEGPMRIAVVARLIVTKGIYEAVEAVRRARARGADVVLDLWGPSDEDNPEPVPEAQLRQWTAEGAAQWHGPTRDIASVWAGAHVAMLLSYPYSEGLPRTLIEAAACGRPLIVTDVAGCRALVRPGIDGFVVPPRDAEGAAAAVLALAQDGALRRRMGAAARAHFEAAFTADRVQAITADLYRTLRPATPVATPA